MAMRRGFSLTRSDDFLEVFGRAERALGFLREVGVESLEFRAVDPSLGGELELVRMCQERGFGITLHPVWEGPFDLMEFGVERGNRIRENFEVLFRVAGDVAKGQDAALVIVVHGPTYPTEEERYYELGVRTMVNFLRWAGRYAEDSAYKLEFGFENRPKILCQAKMGESHSNTLAIVDLADHRLVGITWDMGHSVRNVQLGVDGLYPSRAFMERVNHVHIHDLREGVDHHPLLYGAVPYEEYIRMLAASGCGGVLDLEVPDLTRLGLGGSSVADDIRLSMERIATVL
jgi:sugar phosphate isomerase/epimerase